MNKSIKLQLGSFGCVLATSLMVFGSVVPASAAEPSAPVSSTKKVALDDLDLSTAEGKSAAIERLHETAHTLCSQVADPQDRSHAANYVKCMDGAMAEALPRFAALADSKSTKLAVLDQVE